MSNGFKSSQLSPEIKAFSKQYPWCKSVITAICKYNGVVIKGEKEHHGNSARLVYLGADGSSHKTPNIWPSDCSEAMRVVKEVLGGTKTEITMRQNADAQSTATRHYNSKSGPASISPAPAS